MFGRRYVRDTQDFASLMRQSGQNSSTLWSGSDRAAVTDSIVLAGSRDSRWGRRTRRGSRHDDVFYSGSIQLLTGRFLSCLWVIAAAVARSSAVLPMPVRRSSKISHRSVSESASTPAGRSSKRRHRPGASRRTRYAHARSRNSHDLVCQTSRFVNLSRPGAWCYPSFLFF